MGTYTVAATIRDDDGGETTVSTSIEVVAAALQEDPDDPQRTSLAVGGTIGDDEIRFLPAGMKQSAVEVTVNGVSLGVFEPTDRLISYGQEGDDDIQVAGSINLAAWLYGDDGNDRLKGGAGPDALFGGPGDDHINGGGGRDLAVGGRGADRIVGNDGEDLLIAGFTVWDYSDERTLRRAHSEAIDKILLEWNSGRDFETRQANLDGSGTGPSYDGRLNDSFFLQLGATVQDDEDEDLLTGSSNEDWLLVFDSDRNTGDDPKGPGKAQGKA
jgi:hypothetical protein